jgi:hypothetical protein
MFLNYINRFLVAFAEQCFKQCDYTKKIFFALQQLEVFQRIDIQIVDILDVFMQISIKFFAILFQNFIN